MTAAQRQAWIEEILHVARTLPLSDQGQYLEQACAGDNEVRQSVSQRLHTDPPSPNVGDMLSTLSLVTPIPSNADYIGPYRLIQRIGEGGMGEVYLVEQTQPIRRRAALKLIKPGMDSKEAIARFESERQALAMLDHPCIARVFEAGTTPEGRLYYLMEYVAGTSITKHCLEQSLDLPERLKLFQQVCEGVQHAHDQGIIHRDLKPSNILVAVRETTAIPKIIDFGLAKTLSAPLTDRTMYTRIGAMMGTPEYMSPEQAGVTAQDVDARTDIYSLGVILYELLAGDRPFDSERLYKNGYEGARQIIREVEPAPPSSKNKTLRGDLDRVILKAMHKDRFRRYASAADLSADLQRYLDGAPVLARPSSIAYVAGKYVRRNQLRLMAVALIVAVVIAAFFGLRSRFNRPLEARSIAILPLKDSGGPNAYLSEGLTEELFGILSHNGWHVISARAAERLKDADIASIGQQLKVRLVLDGSVRRLDTRARITLQIEDTTDGHLLWTQTFERPLEETIGAETEMANAVAAALGVVPEPVKVQASEAEANCANPEARRVYLEVRRLVRLGNAAAFENAAGIAEHALQLAPLCGKLWAGLAMARQSQANWGGGAAISEAARKAALQAIALDPNSVDGHMVLGDIKTSVEWDWPGAEAEFRIATKLAPNDPDPLFSLSKMVAAQGRLNDALQMRQRVAELDPLFTTNLRELGLTLHYMGRHQEAIASFEKALARNPSEGGTHAMLSRTYLALGDAPRALAEAEKEPRNSVASEVFGSYTRAMALWALGRKSDSDAELAQLIKKYSKDAPYNIAEAYAFRGEKDRMFEWLNRAITDRDPGLGLELKADPLFAPYRVDARFSEILKKMRLPL